MPLVWTAIEHAPSGEIKISVLSYRHASAYCANSVSVRSCGGDGGARTSTGFPENHMLEELITQPLDAIFLWKLGVY